MNMDLISIVVPVYNTEKYVDRCVKSILQQTYNRIEIILVDDGSTDNAGKICDELKETSGNIIVIHKKNEGLGYARNSGISVANGKYITFIDSDDYISKDHISNLYNCIISNAADACYGGHTKVFGAIETEYPNALAGAVFSEKELRSEVIPRMCGQTGSRDDSIQMSVCMAMYSMDLITKMELRFVSERQFVSEDLIFNLDYVLRTNRICFSDDIGYYYWFNESSLSHSFLPDRYEKSKIMMYEVSRKTRELGIYDLCEQRIINSLLVNTRVTLQAEQKHARIEGRRKAFSRFSSIVKDKELHDILLKYKSEGVRFQARVINCLLLNRMPVMLWCIMAARNTLNI